jgi:hypothetical protein
MRRAALLVAVAVLLPVSGCGDGGDSSDGDRESILRSVRAYFVFDKSPDFNVYCRSFVSVRDQHTLRQGSATELAPDASVTETTCLRAAQRFPHLRQRHPNFPIHTGWPDTQIGDVQVHGDRATVSYSSRSRGRTFSADAIVARIGDSDWRVLRAGHD